MRSSTAYTYANKTNYLTGVQHFSPLGTQTIGYTYGNMAVGEMPDQIYKVSYNGTRHLEYRYDSLGRMAERKLNVPNKSYTYAYQAGGHGANSTTTRVSRVTVDGNTYAYSYDAVGNITAIQKNGETLESYTYDSLNQLKTVTRNGVTTEYSYQNGNIVSVTQNGEAVKSYTYGNSAWKDLLTAYNGQTITYDQIGNPLTYRGKTMTWQNGRQLAGITDGETAISYAYDMDGNRVSKTVNGVTTNYVVLDGALAGEITGGNKLAFLYDESGTKYGLVYNDTTYFYNLNLQDDVVGIYDSTGAEVVTYIYDEWGKLLSCTGTLASTIGQINPIRYRGYYYDTESGLYYVSSRYYDPEVGRFINADGLVSTGQGILGNNMFAYCLNNPVNYEDSDGEMAAAAGALAWGVAAGGSNAWNPAGWIILGVTAIVAIGRLVIHWDSVGQNISNGWNRVKSSARSASISRSISKAVSKAKTKIRNEKRRYDYWIAAYVEYGDGRDAYIPTTPLSYTRAISYVRGGGSVFADSRNNAYKLAKAVGGGTPARDPAHGKLGYWRHYHATRRGRRIGGHVFYVA